MTTKEITTPVGQLAAVLKSPKMVEQYKGLLPPNVSVDRFTRTTIVAVNQNPDILNADRQSLFNAVSRAAASGLLPDGSQGALVIFNQKVGQNYVKSVRFMPMIEGIITQLGKAGISAYAASVYANDKIEIWNDVHGQHVKHHPVVFGDRGALIGVFAAAVAQGKPYVEHMNLEEIDKVRKASRSADRGPWVDWYDRMAQKSVLHRLKKRLPIIDQAIADSLRDPEEEADLVAPEEVEVAQAPVEEKPRKRPRALEAVVETAPEVVVEPAEVPPATDEGDIF